MNVLQGSSISPGFARGTVFLYEFGVMEEVPIYSITKGDVTREYDRFHKALEHSRRELDIVRERVLKELGEAESNIFFSHLSLLKDENFIQKVRDRIKEELINVEHAVRAEVDEMVAVLSEVENEYVRERRDDIRDVGRRVVKNLNSSSEGELGSLPNGSVIVTQELYPSDTLNIDREHVVGIVTERGGSTTHAAILARSLGIPSVSGVQGICKEVEPHMSILVNGDRGEVVLEPSEKRISNFAEKEYLYEEESEAAVDGEKKPTVTDDGIPVSIMGNINRAQDAGNVMKHNLDGVGLFRTEYLFLGTAEQPDKAAQQQEYEKASNLLDGKSLVIRTLDLGGDKKPLFLHREYEANPNLGLRGLRFSLEEKGLLEAQIAAVLRASKAGNIRLMFPMVIGGNDLCRAISVVRDVADREHIEDVPEIGAMIETPAALLQLENILKQVDFVSIGTNDLTQFILAADRYDISMVDQCSVLHPAVLCAIRNIIDVCREHDCPVSTCGEAAGDPRIACLFVSMGISNLSMSPERAPRVRQALRVLDTEKWKGLAQEACTTAAIDDIRAKVEDIPLGF